MVIRLDPESVESNIIVFDIADSPYTTTEFQSKLTERGVRMSF